MILYLYIKKKTPFKKWVLKKTYWVMHDFGPHIDFQWSAIITVIVIIKKKYCKQTAANYASHYHDILNYLIVSKRIIL